MTDAIPAVHLPKHLLDRPGGAGTNPIEKERPWKQLARLSAIAPRLEGDEACCGHCAHLAKDGHAAAPAESTVFPGHLSLSPIYDCALHEGAGVLADNVCQRFTRRLEAGR